MTTLFEILDPNFLLRNAFYNALIVGTFCPLVGVYLFIRRTVFLGVALPQVSACGIASAFLCYSLLMGEHSHGEAIEHVLALTGSIICTLSAVALLAIFGRSGRYPAEARIGLVYVLATAMMFLFLAADPGGEAQMVNLLKGDMLSTSNQTLTTLGLTYLLVSGILLRFRREFTLVAFDPDLAKVFQYRLRFWDALLYLSVGLSIAVGVMTAGPLVVFGFLVIPPLTARAFVNHMGSFLLLSALLGFLSAFLGFFLSYRFDLPLGPGEVAAAGVFCFAAWMLRALA